MLEMWLGRAMRPLCFPSRPHIFKKRLVKLTRRVTDKQTDSQMDAKKGVEQLCRPTNNTQLAATESSTRRSSLSCLTQTDALTQTTHTPPHSFVFSLSSSVCVKQGSVT